MSHKKGFLSGVIVGGIIGGLTALFMTPKNGKKMRQDLKKSYNAVSDKASDLLDEVCDQTEELVEKAKDLADQAKEAACKIHKSVKR